MKQENAYLVNVGIVSFFLVIIGLMAGFSEGAIVFGCFVGAVYGGYKEIKNPVPERKR